MPKHLPLDTLIELAKDSVDEAARVLGRLQTERAQSQQQFDTLQGYRQDYLDRLQQAMKTGMPASDCHNFQRFISTLDDAIAQQTNVLRTIDDNLERGRLRWQKEQRRLNAFDTLVERRNLAARTITQRREQRNSDEYAARMMRHRYNPY